MRRRIAITALLTFRCNLNCPYCDVSGGRAPKDGFYIKNWGETDGRYWVEMLEKMSPAIFHMTGGEPFLYKDFYYVLRNFPKKHLFFIASNLTMPIQKFLESAPLGQLLSFSASFHPSAPNFSLREFVSKLDKLHDAGVNTYVNYVAYPEQLKYVPKLKEILENHNTVFNVDPFVSETYEYTLEEKKAVSQYVTRKRELGYNWEDEGVPKYCSAGQNYFLMLPNGDVYRCHSGFFHHKRERFHLGNFKEGTFKPNTKPEFCGNACISSCDKDFVFVWDTQGNIRSSPIYSSEIALKIFHSLSRRKALRNLWFRLPQRKLLDVWRTVSKHV
ncbi:MAG: radical SAM protein [Thermoproteota archaeon]|nr:radical SAM protein [Thermoproteota archaeon]